MSKTEITVPAAIPLAPPGALLDGPSCESCAHWRRLRPAAIIGRCISEFSGHGFPRETHCCPQYLARPHAGHLRPSR